MERYNSQWKALRNDRLVILLPAQTLLSPWVLVHSVASEHDRGGEERERERESGVAVIEKNLIFLNLPPFVELLGGVGGGATFRDQWSNLSANPSSLFDLYEGRHTKS